MKIILILGLLIEAIMYNSVAYASGIAIGQVAIVIKVQPMCNVNNVMVPVNSKKQCLELQKNGLVEMTTTNGDGSTTVDY